MSLHKEHETLAVVAEPPTKKIKVTNQGSEIKQMRVVAEAARKLVSSSPQPPQPSASKQALSDKTNIQSRPSGGKPVLTRIDIETAKTATIKKPLAADDITLQRMGENALKAIQKRRQAMEIAVDAILPLMKKHHAVQTAVIALQQQVEDCASETRKLRQFVYAAHTGSAKSREMKALLTLASLGPDPTKTLEAEELEAPKPKSIKEDKRKRQNEEDDQTTRVNDRKATTDHPPTKKQKTNAPRAESISVTPRATTPKTNTPSKVPIVRSPQTPSTAGVGEVIRQAGPKLIVSTAHPRSGTHPKLSMGAGMKNFLRKNHLGSYSGRKHRRTG